MKLIVDELVDGLSKNDKLIILAKMRFDLSMKSICQIFQISSLRTAFRRIQTAFEHFTMHINNSKYKEKLEFLLDNEEFIIAIRKSELEQKNACV